MFDKIPRVYWVLVIITVLVMFYMYSNVPRQTNGDTPRRSLRNATQTNKTTFDIPRHRFAGAETFRTAKSPELIAELEKVIEQNGLPADVFVDDVPQATNIALTLHSQFHEYYTKEPNDLQKLWGASPIGVWDINKQVLESVSTTLDQFEMKRQTVRKMLEPSMTRFYYVFTHPQQESKTVTTVAATVNTEASKYLADYALLEEYAIARVLLEGNIAEATEALACIFRIAYLASIPGNIGVRSDAAIVRLRAFDVMQRVVLDPKFEKDNMIYLRDMLLEQHENWISEYVTWFGDRASGISLYHRLSMLRVDNALEPKELKVLEQRGIKNAFSQGFRKYHEADKIFYLQSMQKILDASKEPFIQRQNILKQINNELLAHEDTYDETGVLKEPVVANILLKDVDRLMRLFAQDQSALDRALVVILKSLGQRNTDFYHDPFTDEPYEVRQVDGLLSVSTENLPHPFRVPIFTEKE